jgi:hypothetical protein
MVFYAPSAPRKPTAIPGGANLGEKAAVGLLFLRGELDAPRL